MKQHIVWHFEINGPFCDI